MDSNNTILFSPFKIRGICLKNRICVSPMGSHSAVDGLANDWLLVSAGSFAIGGAGLVVIGWTAVEERGRVSKGNLGLWKDIQIESFRRITQFLKSQGCVAGIQLTHAGRKASANIANNKSLADDEGGWPTIGPSAQAFGGNTWKVPKAATIEDIIQIKESFISAAKRAVSAGFELIELHFGHGYLVSTFLSPITNQRTDKYGGSLENRMRLGLEIAQSVRNALPENIVISARVSVTDYADNGWDANQTIEFAKELKKLGIDFLDCSSGGVVSNVDFNQFNTCEVQRKVSAIIQKEVGLTTGVVGKIIDPHKAEKILQENGATLIFIGRAFINNPHWPYYASDVLNDKTFKHPKEYEWAIGWTKAEEWRNEMRKLKV